MGRPRMKLGEWGSIKATGENRDEATGKWQAAPTGDRKAHRWRARCKIRDLDGVVRDVERYGKTKAAAERSLAEHLRERTTPGTADAAIKPDTPMRDAAATWWAEQESTGRLSPNTMRAYSYALRSHLVGTKEEPAHLAHLTVREIKVSTVHRRLTEVATAHGEGAAKMARQVLSGVLGLAVRHDAIPANPVREVGPVSAPRGKGKPRRVSEARGFTPEERDAVLAFGDQDERAQRRDLGALVAFLAGTGARIGEACALRWSALDLDKGTATLGPVVVRVKGEGLVIQEDGKTKAATRTVHLSRSLVARLLARQVESLATEHGAVFVAPRGGLRDPSNTSHDVRDLLTDVGREVFGNSEHLAWASSHTFRKTVATTLHEAGVSDRLVSNHLGHSRPSMTQDHYLSRRETPVRAAEILQPESVTTAQGAINRLR